ncbi:MAG: Adenine deaminase [Thermotogales bacterium 46_20]|nr:MAG: Adenine deaminase [Thermotogales bacterium 46_20]
MDIVDIVPVARGRVPADVLLKNCKIVNVFNGEIEEADIALFGKRIAGIGDYSMAHRTIDINGAYVVPGLIDAHMHIESSMVSPVEFAKAVLPRGTTTAIADPHEIANVLGLKGIEYMILSTEGVPLNLYIMLPSSVPATKMETNGATLGVINMIGFLEKHPRVLGLGEVMNYPDVINGDTESIAKIELLRHKYKKIDGHYPGGSGKDLNAYVAAFVRSDHECSNPEEAREKLARGMQILIREGSVAKNLKALIPIINEKTYPSISFCTDDKHPGDILTEGHIDYMIRTAIKEGVDPIMAIQCATVTTARHYNLRSMGAISPGYKADLLIVNDLYDFIPSIVIKDSQIVAEEGQLTCEIRPNDRSLENVNTFICPFVEASDFAVAATSRRIRVIELFGEEVLTKERIMEPLLLNGSIVSDTKRDILKIASVCRYTEEKSIAVGFATGTGLKRGAVATSVGHDAHNMGVLGTNDRDMVVAANRVIELGGGLVAAENGKVIAELPLQIAGLMSDRAGSEVAEGIREMKSTAVKMGSVLSDLFMSLSFIQLSVIPELKLTNKGLVDARSFEFVPLGVEED